MTFREKVKVHPLVFKTVDNDEQIIGFIKEPPRAIKLQVMDKSLMGAYSTVNSILEAYILKDESDPRIYSEAPENDKYNIGATQEMYSLIQLAINQFKKK